MQLKSVVLPAPFGPIKPQIAPWATSKDTSWSAVTPPNRIVTPSTTSRAEACGSAPTSARSGFRHGQIHGPSAPGVIRPVKPAVARSLDVSMRLVTCFVIRTLVDGGARGGLIPGVRENRAPAP